MLASENRDGFSIHVPTYEAILAGVEEHDIDVLTIDPFISAHRVRESDNDAIDAVVKELARLADRANIAIELIHHVRKTGGAEVTVEDARGASSLVDAARSARTLTKMTADEARRFGVENHRRYVRVGGDPKSNMTPPATDDTKWMELRSVALGNGTPDYPLGDSVGVLVPFEPVRNVEEAQEDGRTRLRKIVASTILDYADGAPEVRMSEVLADVMDAFHAAKITTSDAPHVSRDKIRSALGGRDGAVVEWRGQHVRLRAEQRSPSDHAPWFITIERGVEPPAQERASRGVFS